MKLINKILKNLQGFPLPTLLRIALLILHTPPYKPVDIILSYSHSNLQNPSFASFAPVLRSRAQVKQLVAASPLNMGLLTPKPPVWHPAPQPLRDAVQQAVDLIASQEDWEGGLPDLALGYAMREVGDNAIFGVNGNGVIRKQEGEEGELEGEEGVKGKEEVIVAVEGSNNNDGGGGVSGSGSGRDEETTDSGGAQSSSGIPCVVGLSSPGEVHAAVKAWRAAHELNPVELAKRQEIEKKVINIFKESGYFGWSWASPSTKA